MKHKKTIAKILAFMMLSIILCGYGPFEKVPDLVNVGKPFIDLSGTVGESIGNAEDAYQEGQNVDVPTGTPVDAPTPIITPEPTPTPVEQLTPTPTLAPTPVPSVKVLVGYDMISDDRDKAMIISVNDRIYDDVDEAVKALSQAADHKSAVLIDNYAEAETFRKIIEHCRQNGIEYTIETRHDP